MKKTVKRIARILLFLIVLAIVFFIRKTFPLINGYAAKTMCSSVFVAGRSAADVQQHELGSFPFTISSVNVNETDSTVTATVGGLFKRKAIFRKGLGATLVSQLPADSLKKQSFHLAAVPSQNQDMIDWPLGNRTQKNSYKGFDTLQLDGATRAIVIVYKNEIIAEKYAQGFTGHTRQLGWSMTKGIENALLGIMVRKHQLAVESPAPLAQWVHDKRKDITIADLMHMSSGLHYASSAAGPSDLTQMLFMEDDMPGFAIMAAAEHPHGQVFHYADASANILSFIERELLNDTAYYKFPYEQLFYKIGMNSAVLEVDPHGTFVGSSYCYATPRDWARFGLLYLNNGVWNGEQLLPADWVKFTVSPGYAVNDEKKGAYGALWWTNAADSQGTRRLPHVPADAFSCQGYEGQFIWIVPSRQLVVVRLALDRKKIMNPDLFLSGIIKALPE